MADARFPIEVVGDVPVVTVPEDIDITNAGALRSALLQASRPGHRTLVVDMTRTEFCDTAGLHALVAAHKQARAEGGQLLAVMRGPAVLRIFAITGLDRVIPHFASLGEALTQASAPFPDGDGPAAR